MTTPPLKVCMLVHQYYYRDERVRRYAEALLETGAQVDVLCVQEPDLPLPPPKDNLRVFTIPVSRGYKDTASYLTEYAVAMIYYTIKLIGLYFKNRYHVIHVHNMPDFLIFAALLPRLFGARLILDIHDPMPEFFMSKYERKSSGLMVRFLLLQEKLSAKFAHTVLTASPTFKERLVSRGIPAEKIDVVKNLPNPVIFDRSRFAAEYQQPRKNFTLIYPGTIAPRYGLDIAIRGVAQLIERIPNIRLLIIGKQVPYVAELKELVKQLKLETYVEFRPPVMNEEVPRQMALADVGIYTSLSDPHMEVAIPGKTLEYAVMGLPIVTSRLLIMKYLFTDAMVLFFEPSKVEEFAECIYRLYQDPSLRQQLVKQTDEGFVQKQTWWNERAIYFNVLDRILPHNYPKVNRNVI